MISTNKALWGELMTESRFKLLSIACVTATTWAVSIHPSAATSLPDDSGLPPYKVMLTSFDPFDGSTANNSQAVVAKLAAMARSIGPNITIETCNLPVVYDVGAQTALDCFNKLKPDAVVSLGEADCSILIETAATNLDDTAGVADNAGNIRTNSPIVAGGPERSGFNFPVEAMFCALPASGSNVDLSISPGGFVCNNVAYHMSQNMEAKNIPFTFIHVPNAECSSAQMDPTTNANTIAPMLAAAFSNLRNSVVSASLWPHPPTNSTFLPTDLSSAQTLLNSLSTRSPLACEKDFANQLITSYNDPNQD
jgi:pyroglutamyl-peptidase